jgi:hypothetical protein
VRWHDSSMSRESRSGEIGLAPEMRLGRAPVDALAPHYKQAEDMNPALVTGRPVLEVRLTSAYFP